MKIYKLHLSVLVLFLGLVFSFFYPQEAVSNAQDPVDMITICPQEVVCLSQMTAIEGQEAELKEALLALVPLTHEEEGCIAYELWQDFTNPKSFIMYERFSDRQALAEHIAKPYIRKFIQNEYVSCVSSQWDSCFRLISSKKEN